MSDRDLVCLSMIAGIILWEACRIVGRWMASACEWLFTPRDIWAESIYAEARSRGLEVHPNVMPDGTIYAYDLIDPTGERKPIRVGALK